MWILYSKIIELLIKSGAEVDLDSCRSLFAAIAKWNYAAIDVLWKHGV